MQQSNDAVPLTRPPSINSNETVNSIETIKSTDSFSNAKKLIPREQFRKIRAHGQKKLTVKAATAVLIGYSPLLFRDDTNPMLYVYCGLLLAQVLLVVSTPGLEWVFKHFEVAPEKVEHMILILMAQLLEGITYVSGIVLLLVTRDQTEQLDKIK